MPNKKYFLQILILERFYSCYLKKPSGSTEGTYNTHGHSQTHSLRNSHMHHRTTYHQLSAYHPVTLAGSRTCGQSTTQGLMRATRLRLGEGSRGTSHRSPGRLGAKQASTVLAWRLQARDGTRHLRKPPLTSAWHLPIPVVAFPRPRPRLSQLTRAIREMSLPLTFPYQKPDGRLQLSP